MIEYSGVAGITQECLDAVMRLIQYGDQIKFARIFSCSGNHCLMLSLDCPEKIVFIKSGFGSGYNGEGPRGFSYILGLFEMHKINIDEYEVDRGLMNRIDNSALTESDIKTINSMRPVRPLRLFDYIRKQHLQNINNETLWKDFPLVIPFAIIDNRIADLAISFWNDPDGNLLKGYIRLEDMIRERTGINESGARLFSQAFLSPQAVLCWKNLEKNEQTSRANLFVNAYMAHRNPKAHRKVKENPQEQLSEFLLLNHLYLLEKEVSKRRIKKSVIS